MYGASEHKTQSCFGTEVLGDIGNNKDQDFFLVGSQENFLTLVTAPGRSLMGKHLSGLFSIIQCGL